MFCQLCFIFLTRAAVTTGACNRVLFIVGNGSSSNGSSNGSGVGGGNTGNGSSGSSVGDVTPLVHCAVGYTGPLCSVCGAGYFARWDRCSVCAGSQVGSVFIQIGFVLAVAVVFVVKNKFRRVLPISELKVCVCLYTCFCACVFCMSEPGTCVLVCLCICAN